MGDHGGIYRQVAGQTSHLALRFGYDETTEAASVYPLRRWIG